MKSEITRFYRIYRRETFILKVWSYLIRFVPDRFYSKAMENIYDHVKVLQRDLELMESACGGLSEFYSNWRK